jgi:RNA polymerase sigma-70 factor (ECF subfamily)
MQSLAPPAEAAVSEEALVEAARSLETGAWATIYERHYRQVYAYAYHRIGNREAAEDLASEVFTQALAGIRSYRYRGRPLLAWLYRIAHNLTSDYLRRRARWAGPPSEQEHNVAIADPELESVPTRQDLVRALSKLSRDQQMVVVLRFLQGLSSVEVGALLGKNADAVRALQSRAMTALRRRLSWEAGRPPAR